MLKPLWNKYESGPDADIPAEGRVIKKVNLKAAAIPCVYLVEAVGSGMVKIGTILNGDKIQSRILTLQTGCPFDLRLVYLFEDCGRIDESRIHKRWDHLRVRREWFRVDGEIGKFMAAVQARSPDVDAMAQAITWY